MLNKGMMELTGAPSPQDAWKHFFRARRCCRTEAESRRAAICDFRAGGGAGDYRGHRIAGVRPKNIVAYDRYQQEFLDAGFDKWLPEGVRWTFASDNYAAHPLQLDMDGYDASQYVEMPLVLPGGDPKNPHHRRSYLSRFISKDVNKMVNLCLLKHHQSAGVTIALKNMSHGLVNNVSRSHSSRRERLRHLHSERRGSPDHSPEGRSEHLRRRAGCVSRRPRRESEELHVGSQHDVLLHRPCGAGQDGAEGHRRRNAMQVGMLPIATAKPDTDSTFLNMQVEHIEIAGALGLGTFDDKRSTSAALSFLIENGRFRRPFHHLASDPAGFLSAPCTVRSGAASPAACCPAPST